MIATTAKYEVLSAISSVVRPSKVAKRAAEKQPTVRFSRCSVMRQWCSFP